MKKLSQKEILFEGFASMMQKVANTSSKVGSVATSIAKSAIKTALPKNYAIYKSVKDAAKDGMENAPQLKAALVKQLKQQGIKHIKDIQYDKDTKTWIVDAAAAATGRASNSTDKTTKLVYKEVDGQFELVENSKAEKPQTASTLQANVINNTSPSKIIPASKYTKLK